jgi:hypothetical protein
MFKDSFEVKINSCQHGTTNTSGICNKYLGSEKITEEGIKNFVGNVTWIKRKREEQKEDITKKALKLGLNDVSMHVWQACCNKHGVGGTPKANEMYDKIMRVIIKEAEK